jgi:hypothetical protein
MTKERASVSAGQWVGMGLALLVLNAALSFGNLWPTLRVVPRAELSIEIALLLLVVVAWTSFVRPLGPAARAALTVLVLVLLLGRYAEVTAPALYGRPVNLYWDSQHLPKVAAMLAEVGPWWLVGLLAVALTALLAALVTAIALCFGVLSQVLRAPMGRRVVGALASAVVALYALGSWLDWPVRHKYSLPVSATYWQQARFIIAAWTADPNRDLPGLPLPDAGVGRLEGDDVLLLFMESYGAVTYDEPSIARVVSPARDELAHAAAELGRHIVSAYASSPTFGGGSWLAHASFMSGVEVRDTGDYMLLLTQERVTWP